MSLHSDDEVPPASTLQSPEVLSTFGAAVGKSMFTDPATLAVMRTPGVHVLSAGVPPPCVLPLASATFKLKDGTTVELSPEEMHLAQRYAPFGWQKLREWLLQHVQEQHCPPYDDWDVCVCAGSMAALDTAFRLLLDPGDVVLCEEYTFVAAKDSFRALGAEVVPLKMDENGLLPGAVQEACEHRAATGLPMPKLLYTIPVGQNPTGSRLHSDRYPAIYDLACKYGFQIVEDDAYYYMQHRVGDADEPVPGLSNLGPSYLSIDVEGRVLRCDTFSKCLAPGLRLAWVTAPKAFLAGKFDGVCYISTQWGCTLSMVLVAKMLGSPGWFGGHVARLQEVMRTRCKALLAAAEAHLSGIASWVPPQAGMFLWVELKGERHRPTLFEAMRRVGVAVQPGEDSAVGPPPHGSNFIRLSYTIDEDGYDEGCRKVARLISETELGEAGTGAEPSPKRQCASPVST